LTNTEVTVKTIALAFALLGLAALVGCPHHRHRPPGHVVVAEGCHHTAHCGHYYHKGKWHHHGGHVHGHGCGHVFRGGIWVIVD
jgi:hypothetical protein